MRRANILVILLLSPLTIQCGGGSTGSSPPDPPPPQSIQLGGGYNEELYNIDNGLVSTSGIRWVRGFVNVPRNFLQFDDPCPIDGSCPVIGVLSGNISQQPDADSGNSEVLAISSFNKLIEATNVMSANGERVKIILSIKTDFKYVNMGIPEDKSPAMTFFLSAVEQLLSHHNLGANIDIVVLGNEPMFETPLTDPDAAAVKYGTFLNQLIDNLYTLKVTNKWKYQIFTGALNKASELQHDKTYGPILQKILEITKARAEVSGIDLHLHVEAVSQAEADVNFVRQELGGMKKIISTEFSLVGLWNKHSTEPLEPPGQFGCPAGQDGKGMKLFDWVNLMQEQATQGQPVSQGDLVSCFSVQSWYPQHWFSSFVDLFSNPLYNVYAATYGLQSTPTIPATFYGPGSTLWYLNFVYNCTLLGRAANGYCNTNPLVFPDFQTAISRMNTIGQ